MSGFNAFYLGVIYVFSIAISAKLGYHQHAASIGRECNLDSVCVGDRVKVLGGGEEAAFLNNCKLTVRGLQSTTDKGNIAWLVVDCGVHEGEFKIGTAEIRQEELALEPIRREE